jgi:hypothetical protein
MDIKRQGDLMNQGTVEITLDYPIDAGSGRIEKLSLRRPKVKDMTAAARFGKAPEDQETALFAALTGLVPEDFNNMDLLDYAKLQDAFRGFLDRPGRSVGAALDAGAVVPLPAERA